MLPEIFFRISSLTCSLANYLGFPLVFQKRLKIFSFSPKHHAQFTTYYILWVVNLIFPAFKVLHATQHGNWEELNFLIPFLYGMALYTIIALPAILQPVEMAQFFNSLVFLVNHYSGKKLIKTFLIG